MDLVPFGSTGIRVSELCYGTMSFGGDADEAESARLYAACRDSGINFFDTADVYSRGRSEELLGKLMAHERNSLVVSSKCWGAMSDDANDRGANRRHILHSVEASLKRLGTDRIDVLFMHQWDKTVPIEETLRALEKLVADGKVIYLGASNYAAWQIATALGVSEKHGWPRFDVLQPMYNLIKRQVESEILPLAEYQGLAVMPFSPVAGGLLSGKYDAGARPEGARLIANPTYVKRYAAEEERAIAAAYTSYCRKQGLHPVSAAVAWVAAHPSVTCPIIGARSVEQLQASLSSVDVEMTPERWADISALSRAPSLATDREEERS